MLVHHHLPLNTTSSRRAALDDNSDDDDDDHDSTVTSNPFHFFSTSFPGDFVVVLVDGVSGIISE